MHFQNRKLQSIKSPYPAFRNVGHWAQKCLFFEVLMLLLPRTSDYYVSLENGNQEDSRELQKIFIGSQEGSVMSYYYLNILLSYLKNRFFGNLTSFHFWLAISCWENTLDCLLIISPSENNIVSGRSIISPNSSSIKHQINCLPEVVWSGGGLKVIDGGDEELVDSCEQLVFVENPHHWTNLLVFFLFNLFLIETQANYQQIVWRTHLLPNVPQCCCCNLSLYCWWGEFLPWMQVSLSLSLSLLKH